MNRLIVAVALAATAYYAYLNGYADGARENYGRTTPADGGLG